MYKIYTLLSDEVGQPPHPDIIYYPGAGAGNVSHHLQQQPRQGGGVHYIQASEQQQSYYDAGGGMHQPMLHQVHTKFNHGDLCTQYTWKNPEIHILSGFF